MKDAMPSGGGDASILHLLHRAGQCAEELFARHIGKSDLTPRQFAVLGAVARTEDLSQTDLVDSTGIDRSTLADIVRRLVSRGLLQRKRTRQDARMYAVRLTIAGRAAIASAQPAATATDEALLAALPAGQRAEFIKALSRIIDHLAGEERATAHGAGDRKGNGAARNRP